MATKANPILDAATEHYVRIDDVNVWHNLVRPKIVGYLRNGGTKAAIANGTGLSASTVMRAIDHDNYAPRITTVLRLAEYFGLGLYVRIAQEVKLRVVK
jgi:DNA-binding XRE family transcriptional regulator